MKKNPTRFEWEVSSKSYFQKKNWDQFEKLWIDNKEKISPQIFHYNLGAMYFERKMWPWAKYHFLKSLKERPHDQNILILLKTIEKNLPEQKIWKCQDSLHYCFYNAIHTYEFFPYNDPWIYLIFLCIIMLFLRRKILRGVIFLTVLIFTGFYYFGIQSSLIPHRGIVVQQVGLRKGPSKIFPVIANLDAGLNVLAVKGYSGHIKVELPSGEIGWVESESLALL